MTLKLSQHLRAYQDVVLSGDNNVLHGATQNVAVKKSGRVSMIPTILLNNVRSIESGYVFFVGLY